MADKTDSFLGILFGIAIGAIIVYAILKRPQQQIQSSNYSTRVRLDQPKPTTVDYYSLMDVENRLNDRLSNLEQKLNQKLNQNLFQTNTDSKQPIHTILHTAQSSQTIPQSSEPQTAQSYGSQTTQSSGSQPQKSNMVQIMENEEDWELKKDDKGKIIGVGVHRKLYSTDK